MYGGPFSQSHLSKAYGSSENDVEMHHIYQMATKANKELFADNICQSFRQNKPPSESQKNEIIRLIGQYLCDMNMSDVCEVLLKEAGIPQLEHEYVPKLRNYILSGDYNKAHEYVNLLYEDRIIGLEAANNMRLMLYSQFYMELLECKQPQEALFVLQEVIRPLCKNDERFTELSGYLMIRDPVLLRQISKWPGMNEGSRLNLIHCLLKLIPADYTLPPGRLDSLLCDAINYQLRNCLTHDSSRFDPQSVSLLTDHTCDRIKFPTIHVQTLMPAPPDLLNCNPSIQEISTQHPSHILNSNTPIHQNSQTQTNSNSSVGRVSELIENSRNVSSTSSSVPRVPSSVISQISQILSNQFVNPANPTVGQNNALYNCQQSIVNPNNSLISKQTMDVWKCRFSPAGTHLAVVDCYANVHIYSLVENIIPLSIDQNKNEMNASSIFAPSNSNNGCEFSSNTNNGNVTTSHVNSSNSNNNYSYYQNDCMNFQSSASFKFNSFNVNKIPNRVSQYNLHLSNIFGLQCPTFQNSFKANSQLLSQNQSEINFANISANNSTSQNIPTSGVSNNPANGMDLSTTGTSNLSQSNQTSSNPVSASSNVNNNTNNSVSSNNTSNGHHNNSNNTNNATLTSSTPFQTGVWFADIDWSSDSKLVMLYARYEDKIYTEVYDVINCTRILTRQTLCYNSSNGSHSNRPVLIYGNARFLTNDANYIVSCSLGTKIEVYNVKEDKVAAESQQCWFVQAMVPWPQKSNGSKHYFIIADNQRRLVKMGFSSDPLPDDSPSIQPVSLLFTESFDVANICLSQDGRYILVNLCRNCMSVWDLETKLIVLRCDGFQPNRNRIQASFCPISDNFFVSGGTDGRIFFYRRDSTNPVYYVSIPTVAGQGSSIGVFDRQNSIAASHSSTTPTLASCCSLRDTTSGPNIMSALSTNSNLNGSVIANQNSCLNHSALANNFSANCVINCVDWFADENRSLMASCDSSGQVMLFTFNSNSSNLISGETFMHIPSLVELSQSSKLMSYLQNYMSFS